MLCMLMNTLGVRTVKRGIDEQGKGASGIQAHLDVSKVGGATSRTRLLLTCRIKV